MVSEAVVLKGLKEDHEQQDKANKEEWRKDRSGLEQFR